MSALQSQWGHKITPAICIQIAHEIAHVEPAPKTEPPRTFKNVLGGSVSVRGVLHENLIREATNGFFLLFTIVKGVQFHY
jgi:hypothetical protein